MITLSEISRSIYLIPIALFSDKDITETLKIFNSKENALGDIIRILLITDKAKEGVNFNSLILK